MDRRCLMVAMAVVCMGVQAVETRIWNGNADTRWNSPAAWQNGVPQEGDRVQIPANATAYVTDADMATVSCVSGIVFAAETSAIEFDIAGTASVPCSICGNESPKDAGPYGTIRKKGTGWLHLARNQGIYNYYSHIVVDDGVLQLPVVNYSTRNQYYRSLTVNSPGVLIPTTSSENRTAALWTVLHGDGIVSNTTATEVDFIMRGGKTAPGNFSGRIFGPFYCYHPSSTGYQNFLGTDSRNVSTLKVTYNSVVGIKDFGGITGSHTNHGSFGTGTFRFGGTAQSCFRYLGDGGISYANFDDDASSVGSSNLVAHLDIASPGGLRLLGGFNLGSSSRPFARLLLSGDFAQECSLEGALSCPSAGAVYVTKQGSGTWHFKNPKTGNGVLAVEGGAIRFDSIGDKGVPTALGRAAVLTTDAGGTLAAVTPVPYAYLLGDGTTATVPTMEYTGTALGYSENRAFAVKGAGRISSTGGRLVLSGGVGSVAAGVNELHLGGTAAGCVLNNVSNGVGTVKVVKEGTGTWSLGGNLDFTGGIDVQAGTLELGGTAVPVPTRYRFYRFTMTSKNMGGSGNAYFNVGRLGLFNATGGVENADLVLNRSCDAKPENLAPGVCAFEMATTTYPVSKLYTTDGVRFEATNLFAFATANDDAFMQLRHSSLTGTSWWPGLTTPERWPSIILRLPEGAGAVTSYDVGTHWGNGDKTNKDWKDALGSWTLYGSTDGKAWDLLSTVISNDLRGVSTSSNSWLYDGASYLTAAGWQSHTGWTIPAAPEGAATEAPACSFFAAGPGPVSVAADATLRTASPLTLNALTLDLTAPNGTLDGFAFAPQGTLTLVGTLPPRPMSVTIPVAFAHATDLANLSGWTVVCGGATVRCRVKATADAVRITSPGISVSFR